MNKKERAQARRLDRLAKGEEHVCERLLAMRSELDGLVRLIDRAVVRHPRVMAGGPSSGIIADLISFRRARGKL